MKKKYILIGINVFFIVIALIIQGVNAEIISRGQNWNKFNNSDGTFTLEISDTINYYNGSDYDQINTTLTNLSCNSYNYCVTKGIYKAYFKNSSAGTEIIKYSIDNKEIAYTPFKLQYKKPGEAQLQLISNSQNVNGFSSENMFTYPRIYGSGFNISFKYENTRLKEELVIENSSILPTPAANLGNNPELSLEFIIRIENTSVVNKKTNVIWNKIDDFIVNSYVDFRDVNNNTIFSFPIPYAYDSNGNRINLTYEFKKSGINLFVNLKVPYSWLNSSGIKYPVYIDPTIEIESDASVVASKNSNSDTNFGGDNYIAVGKSPSDLGEIRSFLSFNITAIPNNSIINSAQFYLWLFEQNTEDSARVINIHRVTSQWTENEVTWNQRQLGNLWNVSGGDFAGNISSNLTIPANPNDGWFIFDLTNLTRLWYNKTYNNYGIILKKKDSDVWEHRFYSDDYTVNLSLQPKFIVNYSINDTTPPLISIVFPLNTTYNSVQNQLNYTISDSNLQSCWYSIDGGANNNSMSCGQNISGLNSGQDSSKWIVYANDSAGNVNSSSITFLVDSIIPTVDILFPQEGSTLGYNISISLNYTASDNNLQSCWYSINGESNKTLSNCANSTFNISEGNHIIILYANDSIGNINFASKNFSVQVGAPTITINYPNNNIFYNNNNLHFNYTPNDIDLMSCELWGNFTGAFVRNQSNNSIISGQQNSFILGLTGDHMYTWNIRCNDSQGNVAISGNRTFIIDTVFPSVILSEPIGTMTSRNNILINYNISDKNFQSCWYNVFRGAIIEIENTSVNCNSTSGNFNVTVDADFVFNFFANDSAGNTNLTSNIFSVSLQQSGGTNSGAGTIVGGSGGGGFISNITIKKSVAQDTQIEFSKLDDVIIYPGEVKVIQLNAKNIGKTFLNKCKISGIGDYGIWIESSDEKNINSGEIVDYLLRLQVPVNVTTNASIQLRLACIEKFADTLFNALVIPHGFFIDLKDMNLISRDDLLVNYTIIGKSESKERVLFTITNEAGETLSQKEEIVDINDREKKFSVILDVSKSGNELLKVAAKKSGTDINFVEEFFVYDSSQFVTGFALLDNINRPVFYIAGIVIVFGVFSFFIIRRILRYRRWIGWR